MKIPCENCITLSMCRQHVGDRGFDNLHSLFEKCTLLLNYYIISPDSYSSIFNQFVSACRRVE